MQLLIRCRADVGLADAGSQTALHVASKSGRPELVRQLLVHGKAHVNRQDNGGNTPLHLAAKYDFSGDLSFFEN
jgi:ankyrin repeat protein